MLHECRALRHIDLLAVVGKIFKSQNWHLQLRVDARRVGGPLFVMVGHLPAGLQRQGDHSHHTGTGRWRGSFPSAHEKAEIPVHHLAECPAWASTEQERLQPEGFTVIIGLVAPVLEGVLPHHHYRVGPSIDLIRALEAADGSILLGGQLNLALARAHEVHHSEDAPGPVAVELLDDGVGSRRVLVHRLFRVRHCHASHRRRPLGDRRPEDVLRKGLQNLSKAGDVGIVPPQSAALRHRGVFRVKPHDFAAAALSKVAFLDFRGQAAELPIRVEVSKHLLRLRAIFIPLD
mmetsp:Transcript_64274/g.150958  ORF Transcript_64274/g.150958 Transcript_64274/m.150958 type:complete len:290 (+) Transcript_64274:1700-2569(+)